MGRGAGLMGRLMGSLRGQPDKGGDDMASIANTSVAGSVASLNFNTVRCRASANE